ncbi:MAG TPA: DUF2339 domain-containing protein [Vicinamibacterales bacterium]
MEAWVFISLVLAIIAMLRALGSQRDADALRTEIRQLRERVAILEARFAERASPAAAAPPPAAAPVPTADGEPPAPAPQAPGLQADVPTVVIPPVPADAASTAQADAGPPEGAVAPEPAGSMAAVDTDAGAGVPPPVPPPESLEARIGARWLLYLGVATLVLGLSYFVKYAFDNEWIPPAGRVLLALVAGFALIGVGRRCVAQDLVVYGQSLTGGGIGVLYLSIYAAHQWYGLIGRPAAFVGMVLVTAAGAVLADRQRSQPLALFAITVGFFTPALVGGDPGAPATILTYLLILDAGTLYLARRRAWPALNLASYVLTFLVLMSWGERHYQRDQYLVVQLYLTAFLLLFLYVYRENRRAPGPLASLTSALLIFAPVVYHLASVAILSPHRGAFFIYLIAFSVAGVMTAGLLRMRWLRLLVWVGAALPLLGYVSARLSRGWLLAAWITVLAIYGLHLIAQAQALDEDRETVPPPEILLIHGNGLWLLAAIWTLLAPRTLDAAAPAAFGLAAFYALLAALARRWHAEAAVHAAGLAAGLTAVACAMYFRGPWMIVSLAAEGVVLVWLALRAERLWLRAGGLLLLGLATLVGLERLMQPGRIDAWPLANARSLTTVFLIAVLYAAAWLHHRTARRTHRPVIAALMVSANLVTVALISSEIDAFFDVRAWTSGGTGGMAAELARQLSLSIAWATYAVVLVAAGLRWRYRPIRYLAIALFGLTIAKVFFVDLATLDRVYRMLSVIGLGLLLLLASYLYQRLRASEDDEVQEAPAAENGAAPPPST